MLSVYRAERRKLLAQLSTRVLALVCALGPVAFAVILKLQSGVPADTLMGVWVHSSGYALPFVVLAFGGFWGFPVLAGALAGDMFSCEDRYGTWKTLLTRSASRRDVFAGKVLAAGTLAVALVALLVLSSLAAGLLLTGGEPLVGLSGNVMSTGECLLLVLVSWLLATLPMLGFTSLAVLFSLATRNGIAGVLGPVLVGLVMQLLALIGSGNWVHALLLASAFQDWHGLLDAHRFYGPLIIGSCVCVLWIAACLGASWSILRRRDFAGTAVTRRPGWRLPLRAVLGGAAIVVVLAAAAGLGPVAITPARVEASLAPTFNRLVRLQQRELGRTPSHGAELNDRTVCKRHAKSDQGPGDDWTCTIKVASASPGELETVGYDVSVESDGCYKATAPPSFVGQQTMTDAHGHSVVNPLFIIYGCFDVIGSPGRCPQTLRCLATPQHPARLPAAPSAGGQAEVARLREAERLAGGAVVRKINEADSSAPKEHEPPGAGEPQAQTQRRAKPPG